MAVGNVVFVANIVLWKSILNILSNVDHFQLDKPNILLSSPSALWRKQGIREIKVCKKCPKVNPYCDAICDPILIKPCLDGAK